MKSSLLIFTLIISLVQTVLCQEMAISNEDEIFSEIKLASIKSSNSQKALYDAFLNAIESDVYSKQTKSELTASLFLITSRGVHFLLFKKLLNSMGAYFNTIRLYIDIGKRFHSSMMSDSRRCLRALKRSSRSHKNRVTTKM